MRLTILGSGTAIPVPTRFPAGHLLELPEGAAMVDCGPGTLRRLGQIGLPLEQLDAVLLTHYHTDHCADLAALLFALRAPQYAGRAPLRLFGAPGLRRLLARLTEAWPWLEPRGYELQTSELLPGTFDLLGAAVTAVPIRHTAQSLGYRVRAPTGCAAFSGDADTCDGLVDLARGADLFVCDSAMPDGQKIDGHLTPGLAAEHAERAGARRLLLTHFYPACDGHDLAAAAAARYRGEVLLAEDLLQFELGGAGFSRRPPADDETGRGLRERR
ncbi:MAG: MBL fold metallo-hydrolase [Planctomycetes bacterium]|nr:MBL fold metallo-hydrolase [Planctomycetota bacterium]